MAAIEYLEKLGMERVAEHEGALASATVEQLAAIPGVTVYGPRAGVPRGAVVAFSVEGLHPHDVAALLDQQGIAVRAGHHCAQPLMRWLGTAGTTRASFAVYTSPEEISARRTPLAPRSSLSSWSACRRRREEPKDSSSVCTLRQPLLRERKMR
jgi:cysteine desulfurase/selenocysteine lyase